MTDSTCKFSSCANVSPLVDGHPTFCSPDCETLNRLVYDDPPDTVVFPWLGPDRRRGRTIEWPS